jgi:hypothetical protein
MLVSLLQQKNVELSKETGGLASHKAVLLKLTAKTANISLFSIENWHFWPCL